MRDIAVIAELGHEACRFALLRAVESGGAPLLSHQWECEVVPGVTDVMEVFRHYIDGLDRPAPKTLSVAVAGAITGDHFTITSSGWTSSAAEFRAAFGFERVLMLNETSARGLAIDMLKPGEALPIGGREPLSTPLLPGRYALVSPDVGLGVCYVQVDEDGGSTMVGTEGGHMAFAARTEFEIDLARRLTKKYGRASYERVISWSGLTEIHSALCDRAGAPATSLTPLEIILYSRTGADPLCVEAVNVFFEVLGDFAGDCALVLGANRGVFLVGRFIAEAHESVGESRFRERFEAKGRLAGVIQSLPTWAIINRASVLNGMARHLIEALADNPDLAGLPQTWAAPVAAAAPARATSTRWSSPTPSSTARAPACWCSTTASTSSRPMIATGPAPRCPRPCARLASLSPPASKPWPRAAISTPTPPPRSWSSWSPACPSASSAPPSAAGSCATRPSPSSPAAG